MPGHPNIIGTVGRTSLVKLNRIANGAPATIALKAEFFNPLGSVKDHIGWPTKPASRSSPDAPQYRNKGNCASKACG